MALENFNDGNWTVVEDQAADITIDSNTKVSYSDMDRDEINYFYTDMGAAHFDGDFEHLVEAYNDAQEKWAHATFWALANSIDHEGNMYDEDWMGVMFYKDNNTYRIEMRSVENGGSDATDDYACSIDTLYYITVKRDEAVGTYGTIYCYIYSDSDRTNLLDTLSITLAVAKIDYRYIYAIQGDASSSNGRNFSGYTQNLDLQEAVGTKALAGTIASACAFSAGYPYRSREMSASFAAVLALTGKPPLRSRPIDGSFASVSAFSSAPLGRLKELTGSFAVVSALAGTPLKRLKELIGSFDAVSAFTGTLEKLKTLAGTIAASTSFTGGLIRRSRIVQGSLAATSSLSSGPLNRLRKIASSLAALSSFVANPLNRLKRLSGSFDVVSTFSGVLTKAGKAVKALAGTIAAISSISASPLKRSRIVQGNFAAISSFTGTPLKRLKELIGSFAASSAFTGALSKVAGGVKALAGTIAVASTFIARPLKRSRIIQGSFASITSFIAAPLNRLKRFSAAATVVSTLVGNLTRSTVGGAKALAGTIAATSAFTGTISIVSRWRQATIQGIENVSGEFVNIVGKIRFKKEK